MSTLLTRYRLPVDGETYRPLSEVDVLGLHLGFGPCGESVPRRHLFGPGPLVGERGCLGNLGRGLLHMGRAQVSGQARELEKT